MYAYQSAEDNYNSLIEQQESGIPVDEEELEELLEELLELDALDVA